MSEVQSTTLPSRRFKDVTGERFHQLVAIRYFEKRNGRARWLYKCDCGKEVVLFASAVTYGRTKSCGCRKRPHGLGATRIYSAWSGMVARCTRPHNAKYPYYGGRGIKVCERWLKSVVAFVEDMGPPPSPKHSIDRIDVNGDYEPSNCRWADATTQANNKRDNRLVTIDGVTKPITQWLKCSAVGKTCVYARLRSGWDAVAALTTPYVRLPRRRSQQ